MRNIFVMLLSLICAQTTYAQETERLTDDEVPFVYESRAKIPTSDEKLAGYLSAEYRNARDEFTKNELLEKIRPVLKSKLAQAKTNSEYFLRVGAELGQYNFSSNTFPSGFSSSTFIPFKDSYAVVFDNVKDIENIPVSLESAKSLSGKLQKNRRIAAVVYCRIIGTQEKQLGWRDSKVLKAHVTKVDFLSDNDELISTINTH